MSMFALAGLLVSRGGRGIFVTIFVARDQRCLRVAGVVLVHSFVIPYSLHRHQWVVHDTFVYRYWLGYDEDEPDP